MMNRSIMINGKKLSKTRSVFLMLSLLTSMSLSAQKLTVESMRLLANDASAMVFENQRKDLNDYAGIVKVMLAVGGTKFQGNGMIEQRLYENGEYWVWMAKDSKRIKIHAPGYLPMEVNFFDDFGIKVESKRTYELVITIPTDYTPSNQIVANFPIAVVTSSDSISSASKMNELGEDYYYGRNGKSQNLSEAVMWIRKSAELGDPQGQYNLGTLYAQGLVVQEDYSEALKWFRKSAGQGYDQAQYNLGVMYSQGLGVTQNYTEALKWFSKSADQGYAQGQYNLGIMYYNGLGVQQNYTEAMKWFRKAAEQGVILGQCNIGYMYEYGIGVEKDYSEAFNWYSKAAEQGSDFGHFYLGAMYSNGHGVSQNYFEAAKWYRMSAEQSNVEAQYILGMMYDSGLGVEKDLIQAIFWYEKAAAQGNEDAKKVLKKLNGK